MSVIDFIRESAVYMTKDRPDLYDHSTAVEELSTIMDSLREMNDKPVGIITFSSYSMIRYVDDGAEEFLLSRKLATVVLFDEEEESALYSWTDDINLPDVDGPDLDYLDDDVLD